MRRSISNHDVSKEGSPPEVISSHLYSRALSEVRNTRAGSNTQGDQVLKVSFYVVIFMIVFGVADLVMKEAGMEGPSINMYDEDQVTDSLNGTRIVEAWNPSLNPFFDIGAGIRFMWNILSGVMRAFPATLSAYGVPDTLVAAVNILYALLTTGIVIEFISGREFMP